MQYTVCSLKQECFKELLKAGTYQLEFCRQPVPCLWGSISLQKLKRILLDVVNGMLFTSVLIE